jgi:uncharacterized phage protein (TIGR01671 family)
MRKIEFRGKDLEDGKWRRGYLRQFIRMNGETVTLIEPLFHTLNSLPPSYAVDEKTIGMSIGLTDCKGKRMFEGDIIRVGEDTFEVKWNEKRAMFEIFSQYLEFADALSFELIGRLEVIGNIYDNPELLNK